MISKIQFNLYIFGVRYQKFSSLLKMKIESDFSNASAVLFGTVAYALVVTNN